MPPCWLLLSNHKHLPPLLEPPIPKPLSLTQLLLLLKLVSPWGALPTAQAQVQYVEGDAATQELNVSVRLPSGEVVRLDGASAAAGQTIDVEWRSVDDK